MVTSKTSLELPALLSNIFIKILLHRKFIKKIKINPGVEVLIGKTYFIIQVDFEIDSSAVEVLESIKFDQMVQDLSRNSLSRTYIQSLTYDRNNPLNVMIEIKEHQSNYHLFILTLISYLDQSNFLSRNCLEYDFYYSLQKELDSLHSFPIHQFHESVINKFFYSNDATISSEDLSYGAYHKSEEIKNQKRIQQENELKKHLANLKLVADVGDYCLVIDEYQQPLNLMEITAIGQGFDDTYIGFEVKTNLKTGRNVIKTINPNIACVIDKDVFQKICKSLGTTRSKANMINFLSDLKNNSQVKYYDNSLLNGKVRTKLQFKRSQ